MREIKFRAYIKDKNCECIVESLHLVDDTPFVIIGGDKYKLEDIILLQYTGLKDKNSVEIYEGDILKSTYKKDSDTNDWIGVVEENSFGGLCLFYKKYRSQLDKSLNGCINDPQTATWVQENCEVVGNIYEKKELQDGNKFTCGLWESKE